MTFGTFTTLMYDHFTMDEVKKLIDFERVFFNETHEDDDEEFDIEEAYDMVVAYIEDAAYGVNYFNEAMSSLIGREFGAGEYDRLEKDIKERWLSVNG